MGRWGDDKPQEDTEKLNIAWAIAATLFFASTFAGFAIPLLPGWHPIEIALLTVTVVSGISLGVLTHKINKMEMRNLRRTADNGLAVIDGLIKEAKRLDK